MDDLRWYTIFMSTCEHGDDSFMYFNEYQHWTFPKHSHKRLVSLNWLISGIESQLSEMEYDLGIESQ